MRVGAFMAFLQAVSRGEPAKPCRGAILHPHHVPVEIVACKPGWRTRMIRKGSAGLDARARAPGQLAELAQCARAAARRPAAPCRRQAEHDPVSAREQSRLRAGRPPSHGDRISDAEGSREDTREIDQARRGEALELRARLVDGQALVAEEARQAR